MASKNDGVIESVEEIKKKPKKKSKNHPLFNTRSYLKGIHSVQRSDNWPEDYFRGMKAKGGNKYAIVATARKIAIIYYKMVRYKEEFKPVVLKEYQEKYRLQKINYLERKLEQINQKQLEVI